MADNIQFTNFASSLLAATISNSDLVIQVSVGDGALFPNPTGDQFFYAVLNDDAGNVEVVQCTSRSGDLLTVVRGQDNTAAQAFTLGVTRVELRTTAIVLDEFIQANGGTMTGDLDFNGNSIIDPVLSGTVSIQGGETVGTPMRGATGVSSNELIVPVAPGRATIGGIDIIIASDAASETAQGILELATQAEVDAGTDDLRAVTPLKLANATSLLQATETQKGALEIATQAETDAGTDDLRAVTPAKLAGRAATETLAGVVELATQAEVDAGTDTVRAVTPATLAGTGGVSLATFTGVSTITGLTSGKKYAVTVSGSARTGATTGNDTLGGVRVGDGTTVGSGTELADIPNSTINWPDGSAWQSHTHIITTIGTSINGTVDHVDGGTFQAAKAMTAIQLD